MFVPVHTLGTFSTFCKFLTCFVFFVLVPFEKLAIDKQMAAYKFEKYWDCMDTFKDMQTMNKLWKDGSAPWKRW